MDTKGYYLGVDVGSVSTNLVIIDEKDDVRLFNGGTNDYNWIA